ncbi:MAG: NADH-quinone oxidoreductase subunit H [SAR202 cluster bacterium Io17-Chloro-G7]|nr:MAG: NADH-quinone oxidoreductase subunit H [SAR202 cluster bacterium Io17-Chloro-G7]
MNCVLGADNILHDTVLFRVIYEGVGRVLPCWLSYLVAGLVIMLILVNAVLLGAAVLSWMERRLIGRMHNRIGPNRWGPFGLLQPIADLVKLMTKENLTPANADRVAFLLVPVLMLMPVILVLAVVPFAKDTALADLNIGVLYVLAVSSISTIAIFMAGWSSNNRYAMFGAARGVAVLISYEIPLVLSLLGVVMVAGSMSLSDVVEAQNLPFLLVQPLALFVFLAGMSAELNRTPFDVAEAESEIIAGYHIEYSGIKFALIQAAEFGATLAAAALVVTFFLSGWDGPAAKYIGWLWFLIKMGVVLFMFIWVRATFPRLRIDQLMALAWKFLLPLSLVNLAVTTVEVYFFRNDSGVLSTNDLWVMTGINIAVTIVSIGLFGTLIRQKVKPPKPLPRTSSPGVPSTIPSGVPSGVSVSEVS